MALTGYIGSGTYCAISNTFYEKSLKRCTVLIDIYDETKKNILASTSVSLEGAFLIPSIASVVKFISKPSEMLVSNCFYLIGTGEEDLKNCDGRLAKKDENGSISTYVLTNNSFLLFAEDDKKYYEYNDGAWKENFNITRDLRLWNKWLAPEVALAPDTNPTQQMYKFIKTLSLFKDCQDA